MRARVDPKTVASFHSPISPTMTRPTMNAVCSAPIRNSVKTESPDSVAHPVGFGDVAPAPDAFHPLT